MTDTPRDPLAGTTFFCTLCRWQKDIGGEAHATIIHPDVRTTIIRQWDTFFIFDAATLDATRPSGDEALRLTGPLAAARRLLQGQFAYCQNPEGYYPGDYITTYDDVIDKALAQALDATRPGGDEALRAALHKRAIDAARDSEQGDAVLELDEALALIDAALAAPVSPEDPT